MISPADPLDITLPSPGAAMRALYDFDPGLRFLNHGSFGAVARPVKAVQDQWRLTIDQNPDGFIRDQWPGVYDAARLALGAFVGANPSQLGLVSNATAGTQAAAMAAPLKPGQRILVTNHIYRALRNMLTYVCEIRGTTLEALELPINDQAGDALLTKLEAALVDDVGLLVVDHITSPTALRFPIQQIVKRARAAGVPVLIDGAHGPGFEALQLNNLNADWYVGNGHKWLSAPRGTAFIWCHEKWLDRTETPIISHQYGHGFEPAYQYYGTIDFSAWSTLPAAIEWYRRLEKAGHFTHAQRVLWDQVPKMADALHATMITPTDKTMMAAMLLPARYTPDMMNPLRQVLQRDHDLVAVFVPWGERLIARLSAYSYNEAADYKAYQAAMLSIAP